MNYQKKITKQINKEREMTERKTKIKQLKIYKINKHRNTKEKNGVRSSWKIQETI